MKPVIILAGGFGTRLSSILKNKPKPMADINGKPFLELLIQNLSKNGFNKFILSLHYKPEMIINYFNQKNYDIKYVIEPKPLGTGGAIKYVIDKFSIDGYVYIVNGDSWMDDGYFKFKDENKNIISVVEADDISRYGKVEINEINIIKKFLKRRTM